MTDSILLSVKHQLGLNDDDESFDPDIINCINVALNTLTQLGMGPKEGITIVDKNGSWNSVINDDPRLESIKTYVFMKVKMLFDPPQSGGLIDVYKSQIKELEFRLNLDFEFPDI